VSLCACAFMSILNSMISIHSFLITQVVDCKKNVCTVISIVKITRWFANRLVSMDWPKWPEEKLNSSRKQNSNLTRLRITVNYLIFFHFTKLNFFQVESNWSTIKKVHDLYHVRPYMEKNRRKYKFPSLCTEINN
jgi:hypothetical protein